MLALPGAGAVLPSAQRAAVAGAECAAPVQQPVLSAELQDLQQPVLHLAAGQRAVEHAGAHRRLVRVEGGGVHHRRQGKRLQ